MKSIDVLERELERLKLLKKDFMNSCVDSKGIISFSEWDKIFHEFEEVESDIEEIEGSIAVLKIESILDKG